MPEYQRWHESTAPPAYNSYQSTHVDAADDTGPSSEPHVQIPYQSLRPNHDIPARRLPTDRSPLLPSHSSSSVFMNVNRQQAPSESPSHVVLYAADKRHYRSKSFIIIVLLSILFGSLVGFAFQSRYSLDPGSSAVRERIRHHWEVEREAHDESVRDTRRRWDEEVMHHNQLRLQMAKEAEEWNKRQAEDRKKRDEEQRDWDRTREKERQEREMERKEREEERKKREEDEKRKKDAIHWEGLLGGSCLHYGTKEYTAMLANVPFGYDALKACQQTKVDINGVLQTPTFCDDLGSRGMRGHWHVNGEASCRPTWNGNFRDKGCTSQDSHLRRIECHLENMRDMDHWEDMCNTTPANFRGRHFNNPTTCANWGKNGIWGIWEINDPSC